MKIVVLLMTSVLSQGQEAGTEQFVYTISGRERLCHPVDSGLGIFYRDFDQSKWFLLASLTQKLPGIYGRLRVVRKYLLYWGSGAGY